MNGLDSMVAYIIHKSVKYDCNHTQDGSEDHIISRCGKTTITVSAKATNQAEIY